MIVNEDFSSRNKVRDIGRWYVNNFVKDIAEKLPNGTSILDAGAGECVYQRFFAHCDYKSIDLAVGESKWNYSHLDYIAPLHAMPIPDESFDAILCTQVLEHIEWPRESVKEMCRVLKSGGKLYITVPMSQGEHQIPYDFFRYTSFGLKSICEHAGFKYVDIKPFGGLLTRWAYELPRFLGLIPSVRKANGKINLRRAAWIPIKLISLVLVRALQYALLECDRFEKRRNDPFGWSCIATK